MRKAPDRAQGQAEGGVQQPQGHPEEVAADEAGGLPGNGGEDHLEGLDQDEHQGRQGPRGLEDGLDPMFIGAEARYMAHLAPQVAAVVKPPEQQPQDEKGQNQQSPEPRSVPRREDSGPIFSHLAKHSLFTINPAPFGITRQSGFFRVFIRPQKRLAPREPAGFSISQPWKWKNTFYNSSRCQALIQWYKYSRYR